MPEKPKVLKHPDEGDWSVHSDFDPRWNMAGHKPDPDAEVPELGMGQWVRECKEKYGDPPKDCVFKTVCYF